MPDKLILEPGDIICSKCDGKGYIVRENVNEGDDYKFVFPSINVECDKCWGAGKLDWIENIVGKANPRKDFHFKIRDLFSVGQNFSKEYECSFENDIVKRMANQIRLDIDNKILKYLTSNYEGDSNE